MLALLAQQPSRIGSPVLGVVIPAVIFTVSFLVAYGLYRHFSRQVGDEKKQRETD